MKDNLPDKDGFFGEYGGKFVPRNSYVCTQ